MNFPAHYKYIVIEGNIGAGKTSLTSRISKEFNGKLILEQFADNPFLPKFYENPSKYAFPLELSFLAERYQQLTDELGNHDLFSNFMIADYYFSKSLIFAQNTLPEDEFLLYKKLFSIIYRTLPKPDLMVYLYLDTESLLRNIRSRGREYEKNIQADYLEKIQSSYIEFLRQQPEQRTVIVDTGKVDFVNNKEHYQQMLEIINAEYPVGITRIVAE
ncbi:MAG: deoxynucleoside kinase [Bacteroidota bacterium]